MPSPVPFAMARAVLGKLVRDETIYQHMLDLSHRGERTLNVLEENLDALKQTWPFSSYFEHRAYLDRERVLFQPGAERKSRALQTDELFEPGRSILTQPGRARLDEIGRWCKKDIRPTSQVVIAAFTDGARDQDLAEILTQEQADTVRRYLIEKHGIQSAGWFRSRKVAAVGFGTHTPRALDSPARDTPTRRVEIILFTPQT
jgi:phospholipid/cholesterol/gamma-HCH transport system substrate-binding protein